MRALSEQERDALQALDTERWLRPMDIGGRDGSHHSATLQRLVRLGLVEREKRSFTWGKRGSYVYRKVAN